MAMAVGKKTATGDNPSLTARHLNLYRTHELPPKQPTRIVIGDGSLLPRQLNIFKAEAPTILFIPDNKEMSPTPANVTISKYDPSESLLPQICHSLYEQEILSVIIEGGAQTLQSFIEADLWDEARVFTAPRLFTSGIKAPELRYAPEIVYPSGSDSLAVTFHPKLAWRLGVEDSSITQLLPALRLFHE
jgi:diaminohydroxyphosphoribosylaminopyrimidine deaminase/5-amino-6-(5-phosphoribosylamino)uracil reductase